MSIVQACKIEKHLWSKSMIERSALTLWIGALKLMYQGVELKKKKQVSYQTDSLHNHIVHRRLVEITKHQ